MLRTKITTIAVSLAAALSFAGAARRAHRGPGPVAQLLHRRPLHHAHELHVGGVSPCAGISSGYDKAYDGLLEALQNQKELPDKVHPEMTPKEAQEQVEDAEAAVHAADLSAFEWGCSVAAPAHTVPPSIKGQFTTILGHLQLVAFNQVRLKEQTVKVSTAKVSAR